MTTADHVEHEFDDLKGKAKEEIGDLTDNESLQAEGMAEQAGAKVGKAADDVREALDGDPDTSDEIR
jgi:uncharacterized protein YjbJ (UPF0337 family)